MILVFLMYDSISTGFCWSRWSFSVVPNWCFSPEPNPLKGDTSSDSFTGTCQFFAQKKKKTSACFKLGIEALNLNTKKHLDKKNFPGDTWDHFQGQALSFFQSQHPETKEKTKSRPREKRKLLKFLPFKSDCFFLNSENRNERYGIWNYFKYQ